MYIVFGMMYILLYLNSIQITIPKIPAQIPIVIYNVPIFSE